MKSLYQVALKQPSSFWAPSGVITSLAFESFLLHVKHHVAHAEFYNYLHIALWSCIEHCVWSHKPFCMENIAQFLL